MYARGRPHRLQRRTVRELNFGFRFAFWINDVFAMRSFLMCPPAAATAPGSA